MKMINELEEGERIHEQFVIGNVSRGTNVAGIAFLNMELRDSSGSINGKKWEVLPGDEELFAAGNVVAIDGDVTKFKESLQIKVLSGRPVLTDDIEVSKFLKAPPVPKEKLIEKFKGYIESIHNEDAKRIIKYIVNKLGIRITESPAAVSIHHEYSSGLLMHTVSMADLGEFLAGYYPDVDRDMLISGILLHDMGKVIELEGPVVYHYSLEGKLLGHISIVSALVKEAADALNIHSETALLLQHMVLAHHGSLEFGSPVLPQTKEALLLSLIDNLDSRMVVAGKALEGIGEGEFTQRIFPLDNRTLYKPKKE